LQLVQALPYDHDNSSGKENMELAKEDENIDRSNMDLIGKNITA